LSDSRGFGKADCVCGVRRRVAKFFPLSRQRTSWKLRRDDVFSQAEWTSAEPGADVSGSGTMPLCSGKEPAMLEPPLSARSPQITVTADGEIFAADTPANRDLARRVQACINACAGFTTEDLERGIVDDMRRVIEQLAPLAAARAERAA